MNKIDFKNLPDTTTPLSAENLNLLQDNIEDAIPTLDSAVSTSSTNGIENQAITNYVNTKSLEVYSTTETRIGTWTDGKPLYRKVFNNISITSSNTDLVDTQSIGISEVVKIYGALSTSTGAIFPIPLTDSSSNYSVIFWSGYAIRGRASIGSGTLVNCWVAIEYTKTTD